MTARDIAVALMVAVIAGVPTLAAFDAVDLDDTSIRNTLPPPAYATLPPVEAQGDIGEPAWSHVEYATVTSTAVRQGQVAVGLPPVVTP